MAKKKVKTVLVKLLSQAGTGFFYLLKKNPTKNPAKVIMRKHDPVVNQHVIFQEAKLK